MASNPGASNPAGVTAVAVATTSATGAPTIKLSGEQATQLLQRLRSLNAAGGTAGTQGIKIQAVQTNPQTGVKHIIAIPIQATGAMTAASGSTAGAVSAALNAAGAKLTVSPLKMRATPVAVTTSGAATVSTMPVHSTTSVLGPNVKVVKLAASATPPKIQQQVSTPVMQSEVKYVASMLEANSSSSRKRSDIDFDAFVDAKRKKTDKGGKGLRHFSMKVCEKVQAKGSTSYNEVADELVAELTNPRCASPTDQQYDQKNIRRRVYDALNVLMAMNIISKEKKEIHWLGLPTNSIQEANGLEKDKAQKMERIKAKTQQLQDLILQQIAFKNLVERNKDREKVEGPPAPNSAIHLPFIIVNTSKKTVIDCRISNDKMEYLFNFDDTFEIHDDMEVLKRMGMSLGLECGQVSQENLAKARTMVPRALEQYVTELAEHGPGSCTRMPEVTEPVFLQHGDNGDYSEDQLPSEPDSDSDVDIY